MNILIIQKAGGHEKNSQFKEALNFQRAFNRLGVSSIVWGPGYRDFQDSIDTVINKSDVIFLLENYNTEWIPDLSKYSIPKIFWSIDAHCVFHQHLKIIEQNKINCVLSSTFEYCSKFNAKSCFWFPNAYPSDLIEPRRPFIKRYDVGFCGNTINRGNWIKDLGMHHDQMVLGEDMVQAVCSYRIHWNRNISNDINCRTMETLGCGTFLLTNHTDRLSDLFSIGKHLITYDSENDCKEKIKYYIEHEKERETIAREGHEYVRESHSFDCRAKQFIEIVSKDI